MGGRGIQILVICDNVIIERAHLGIEKLHR